MKLFMCCLILLPFATTARIRVRRQNVLSFLNDALGTTTEKTTSSYTPAYRNPPRKPVKEQDSEDTSDAKSTEISDTNGVTEPGVSDTNIGGESRDALEDLDSYEITIPKAVQKDKAPSRRKMGVDKDNTRQTDMSSRPVLDYGSREYSGPQGALVEVHQASRERIDLNSEEGLMVEDAQEAGNLQRKQVSRFSGDRVTDSASQGIDLQRKASSGGAAGLDGMLAPGRSRELLDQDSLEDNNGRPAAVGNSRDLDYDETREFISSEMYPLAPPQRTPSSFSAPAKI